MHNNRISTAVSESQASASHDEYLKGTSTNSNSSFLFLLKVETNAFRQLWQKHIVKYNRATKEMIQAADEVWLKCKQMTPPSVAGTLTSYTPYGRKSKQRLEITDVVTWWKNKQLSKSSIQSSEFKVENMFLV